MERFTVVIFLLGLALIPSLMAWQDWRTWYMLRRFGAEAVGEVMHHWVGKIGIIAHYYIIYGFEAEDQQGEYFYFTRHTELSREDYQAAASSGVVRVCYASANPRIFRLIGQATEQWAWTLKALLTWGVVLFFFYVLA